MGSFGDRLKRERELRSISLDEISSATKIGTRMLQALEEEDFAKLPGGVFNRGFVRAYAKFLGINEEEAIADYLQAAGEEAQPATSALPFEPESGPSAREFRNAEDRSRARIETSTAIAQLRWTPLLIVTVLLAIVTGGVTLGLRKRADLNGSILAVLSRLRTRGMHHHLPAAAAVPQPQAGPTPANPQSGMSGNSGAPVAVAAPINQSGTQTGPAQAQPAGQQQLTQPVPTQKPATVGQPDGTGEFTLLIRAKDVSWISFVADQHSKVQRMLHPGDPDVTVTARQLIKLTAGNPEGVEISLNGKELPALGSDHRPRTVLVTASGIEAIQ